MISGLTQFVKNTYFHIYSMKANAQEIWNGFKNIHNRQAELILTRNIYRIALKVVNSNLKWLHPTIQEEYIQKATVQAWEYYKKDPIKRFLRRFPSPPSTKADEQKVKNHITTKVILLCRDEIARYKREKEKENEIRKVIKIYQNYLPGIMAMLPSQVIDFEELRIIDVEYPIFFTEREEIVIKGIVLVYLKLLGVDKLFAQIMEQLDFPKKYIDEFRNFASKIAEEEKITGIKTHIGAQEWAEPQDPLSILRTAVDKEDTIDRLQIILTKFENLKEKYLAEAVESQ